MHDLWKTILQTSGVKIYSVLLGILSITLTARILGPEGRGELVAIYTWVTTFATFAYLSLGQVANYYAAKSEGRGWLPSAYRTLISFTVVMTIIAWFIAGALLASPLSSLFSNITPAWLLIGFLIVPFKIWELYASALFQAIERLDILNRYQLIGNTIGFLTTLGLLLVFTLGIEGVIASNILSQFIIASGSLLIFHRMAGGWSLPTSESMLFFLNNGLKLHMNAIGMFFITGADILMLNHYRGNEETAHFQLSVQLMGILMLIPQVASMVINGKICSQGPDKAWPAHRNLLVQVTLFVGAAAIMMGITAGYWIPFVLGEEYNASVEIFRLLLLASIGMTISIIMTPQWIGRGYLIIVSLLTFAFGGINLLLNWLLIPKYGMHGAVTATIITYAASVVVNGFMIIKCNNK